MQHPPRSNVYLVDEDATAGDPSNGGRECEEDDGEDVVAAHVTHSHEERSTRQHTCKQRKMGTSAVGKKSVPGFIYNNTRWGQRSSKPVRRDVLSI